MPPIRPSRQLVYVLALATVLLSQQIISQTQSPPPAQPSAASTTTSNSKPEAKCADSGTYPTTSTPMTETKTVSNGLTTTDAHAWTDAAGNTRSFTVNYSQYTQKTNFGCSDLVDIGPTTVSYPSSITSPEGNYTISYELTGSPYPGDVTGRISRVTFPSGASVQYSYTGGNKGITCPVGIGQLLVPVLTRKLTDKNGKVSTWTYNTSAVANATVVTDPTGNDTVHTFSIYTGNRVNETLTQIYQGSRTANVLLKTNTLCYNGNSTNCPTAVVSGAVTQQDVYTTLPGMSGQSLSETHFDLLGDLIEDKEFDFGLALVSDRVITYGSYSGGSCSVIANVNNRICTDILKNGTGSVLGQKNNAYDGLGNLLSSSSLTAGSTYITKSLTHNSNGTVNVITDVNGAQTTYGNYTCNGNFPTTIAEPLALSKSMTWDCNGGVVTSVTDENSLKTIYGYVNPSTGLADPFYRLLSVTDPLTNVTNYSYSPTTFESAMNFNGSVSTTDSLTTTDGFGHALLAQTKQAQGSSTFDTIQYVYDASFRLYTTSIACAGGVGASCPTLTTTTYDGLNRPLQVADAGTGYAQYNYAPSGTYQNDVLSTIGPAPTGENTKRKQLEYDGLGRLTSVCELTSTANGGGNCLQTAPQTGYWTKYAYNAMGNLTGVTQNAQGASQTRSYQYDSLGRLTSELNPEWGPGTATYTYDTDSTCGTSNGDLVKKVDSIGNVTCYSYDALHRIVTIMVYQAGTCFPPVKRFRYDSTANAILPLPSGYSASNTSGRMIEAWTGDCVWPTPASGYDTASDEWFAYSSLGAMTDLWESTAHIAGYFHGVASYAPNGAITSIGGVPSYGTITYGLDGEGRLKTATQGANELVTGVTYMPSSQPQTISFGTGDSDGYTYDTNTGRMTNYTFTVNGASDSGGLTWNPNGTLGQLQITDGINSGGSQTCTYGTTSAPGYDDVGRLLNVNCGSVWSQAFTYDPYGNITKSGSSAWAPGYSSTTNHASPPITYDNNGNMTNDTLRTYAWYVDNKLGSINSTTCTIFGSTDGTCILYDALGREVEKGVNGVYTEVMYTPAGKTAIMNGQTSTVSAYFPLPGGGTYYQSGGTGANGYFWHKDWLGSVRLSSSVQNKTSYFDRAFAPYGETYDGSGNATGIDFTGDTEDSFVGLLFDTPNRELHPGEGRWISPDPAGIGAVDLTNPQSLNRYAYVLNNPLSTVDPSGLWCVWDDGTGHDADPSEGGSGPGGCEMQGGHWDPYDTITNIFQTGGIVTEIDYSVLGMNYSYNPAGMTLEGLDATLNSYSKGSGGDGNSANNGTFLGWDPNAWRAFRKSLFSWKNFSAGFKEGGCFQQFAEEMFDPSDMGGTDAAIKTTAQSGAYVAATAYAARQGLVVPMRSSIVRGILDFGEFAGEAAALGLTDYEGIKALKNEVNSFANGECQ